MCIEHSFNIVASLCTHTGDALDMMNIHHQLLAVGCKIELFAAKSLEGKTHEDIRTLASLLVAEISTHIKHSVLSLRKLRCAED